MNPNNVILQTASKFAFFLIILFSIYIFFAGHNSPGGGFVGGLLTTGAFVLLLLAYDINTVQKLLPFNSMIMVAVGLLLALRSEERRVGKECRGRRGMCDEWRRKRGRERQYGET